MLVPNPKCPVLTTVNGHVRLLTTIVIFLFLTLFTNCDSNYYHHHHHHNHHRQAKHFIESDVDEPIVVFSSAHEKSTKSRSEVKPKPIFNDPHRSGESFIEVVNKDNYRDSKTEDYYLSNNTSQTANISASLLPVSAALTASMSTISNESKASLMEPLTKLVMLYLTNRGDSLRNQSVDRNHTGSSVRKDSGPMSSEEEKNSTLSESRTLASWLSSTLGWGKKRRNGVRPTPQRSDYFVQRPGSMPVNTGLTGFPVSQMMASPPLPVFRPGFLPNPEGFPGPLNPDSILLPPDLLENSGIDYWLNYIEKGVNENKNPLEMSGTENSDMNFPQAPRPRPRPRPRPLTITRPIKMRAPTPPPPPQLMDDYSEDQSPDRYNSESGERNREPYIEESVDNKQKHYENSPRCDKFTSHICVDDFEYPEQAIVDEIYKRRDLFELMYSEVKDNSPMVEGVPRDVEESYTYEHYFHEPSEEKLDPMASGSEFRDESSSGYICPSEILYGKPKLARNVRGLWKVIVNAAEFTQTVRMEKCLRPNEKCNHIVNTKVNSRCAQVHSVHRLMVFEKGKGFYIDTFRIPTACSCHVSRRPSASSSSTSSSSSYTLRPNHPQQMNSMSTSQTEKNPSTQLSNIWSILSSNGNTLPEATLDTSSLLNSDILRSQLALLQQLKSNPQLAAQLSTESLLQQLADTPLTTLNALEKFQTGKLVSSNRPNSLDYLLPSLLYGASDGLPLQNSALQQLLQQNQNQNQQQQQQQQHQLNTNGQQAGQTTTFIRPGNGNGAPVVQVIHVPVTSTNPFPGLGSSAPASLNFNGMSAFESKTSTKNTEKLDRTNNLRHGVVGGGGSNSNGGGLHNYLHRTIKPNSTPPGPTLMTTTFDDLGGGPLLLRERVKDGARRKQGTSGFTGGHHNGPTLSPVEDSSVLTKRKTVPNNEEKINFSYHPILEYIKHPPKEDRESRTK